MGARERIDGFHGGASTPYNVPLEAGPRKKEAALPTDRIEVTPLGSRMPRASSHDHDLGVEERTETRTALGRPWNVIVWDDPINLMDYVVYVFQRLFGMSVEAATRHMLEVHNDGRSIVASVERERAEFYVGRLHGYGLQATMEQAGVDDD